MVFALFFYDPSDWNGKRTCGQGLKTPTFYHNYTVNEKRKES
jgi:hypothetical protein